LRLSDRYGERSRVKSVVLLLVAALLLTGAVLLVWAWVRRARLRRQVPARHAPRLRHPVVLAHGAFGFDEIAVAGRRHRYFRNIAEELAVPGVEFYRPRVAPAAPIAVRAGTLVELLRALPGDRFNVIAHSMGGLDARFAIARLGLADRITSLVTIGAPHHGTPLAELPLARATARLIGLDALADLRPAAVERFNQEVRDVEKIAYCSVVAASKLSQTNPLLWPTHLYLSARSGRNDGVVPQASQRWGRVLREIEADHWAQVGWSLRFDAVGLYEEILRELAALGF
jgi:triacylglycerol lipase